MKEEGRKWIITPMLVDFSSHMTDKFLVASSSPFSVLSQSWFLALNE